MSQEMSRLLEIFIGVVACACFFGIWQRNVDAGLFMLLLLSFIVAVGRFLADRIREVK